MRIMSNQVQSASWERRPHVHGARARQRAAEAPLRHGRVRGRAHARAALRRAPAAGDRMHVHGEPRGPLRHMSVSVHSQSSTRGNSVCVAGDDSRTADSKIQAAWRVGLTTPL
jgi:hypothetical protein